MTRYYCLMLEGLPERFEAVCSCIRDAEPKASDDPDTAKRNAEASERSLLWNLGWFADPVYFGDYVSALFVLARWVDRYTLEELGTALTVGCRKSVPVSTALYGGAFQFLKALLLEPIERVSEPNNHCFLHIHVYFTARCDEEALWRSSSRVYGG